MSKNNKEITKDLLKSAGYYWYDDNEDRVSPIQPNQFDPVVDKLFKANAMELEKLYAEIDESQNTIITKLSENLVPDQSLLPEPGYTIAQITPKVKRVSITPYDRFQMTGIDDEGKHIQFYFTSLFEHHFPSCNINVTATQNTILKFEKDKVITIAETPDYHMTSHLWLGLDLGKIEEGDIISFFLGNKIFDEFEKDYAIFHAAKWYLNGDMENELKVYKGLNYLKPASENNSLMEKLEVNNSYEKRICTRFRNGFIQLPLTPQTFVEKNKIPQELTDNNLFKKEYINKSLCWIKIKFPMPISEHFLKNNRLSSNCIPLVNRRKIEKFVVKRHYDRILLPMPTDDYFLDIDKVQDVQHLEKNPTTGYQRITTLDKDLSAGTFSIRNGDRIRRLNRADATQQIYRLLEVIQDEYNTFKEDGISRLREDFEIIDEAIGRIKENMSTFFRATIKQSPYFGIAYFRPEINRIDYSYWETQGNMIKHLGGDHQLKVSSKDVHITESRSIIPIQEGRGKLKTEEYIQQLKTALLSRGRIMSRSDISMFCQSKYGHLLNVKEIRRTIMMGANNQLERGLLVVIQFTQNLSLAERELIRVTLQNDLNANSAFFTSIKVKML